MRPIIAVIALLGSIGDSALGQPPFAEFTFTGGAIVLLSKPEVQRELRMDAAQKKELNGLISKYKDASNVPIQSGSTYIRDHLKPEQKKRLQQIELQAESLANLLADQIQRDLELTAEQKERIQVFVSDMHKRMSSLPKANTRQQNLDDFNSLRAECTKKVLNTLTQAQQSKWKALIGAPFPSHEHPEPDG
jgi:hypothetical protein